LALALALAVTQELNWTVRMLSEMETNMVAVERICRFSHVPVERDVSAMKDATSVRAAGLVFTGACA